MTFGQEDVDDVGLGGIAAMATRTSDQSLVSEFGRQHGARYDNVADATDVRKRRRVEEKREGVEVIACFGYHPWFSHLLSLDDSLPGPSKRDHYRSLFLPSLDSKHYAEQERTLDDILPGLPEPTPFAPLLTELKRNIAEAQGRGQLVMLGEVGLDKSFRVPYPHITAEHRATVKEAEDEVATSGQEELVHYHGRTAIDPKKVLTPFRPTMEHQIRLLEMQMDVAVALGVNVSLHSVQCQGPTVDFLRRFANKHGSRFTDCINVDIHSCGGWSVESWVNAEKHFPNLYLSPSLAISSRSPVTPSLIRAASSDRLLMESDTHLIGDTTRRVWASTVWIARCRRWRVHGDDRDGDVDVVDQLERNWKRFMRLAD